MSSTRSIVLLLVICAVSFAGCKKKGATAGGDAEPAGSAAPADSSSAAAPSGGEGGAATDDGAATAAADASGEGGDQGTAADEGGALDAALTPSPTGPTGGGNTFTGNYNCMGGLSLTQTGNGVRGSAITRNGETVTNYDITCTVIGNECKGNASKFVSKGGHGPKSAGGSKVTFKLANGGLSYTEGGVGGFCTRK
jgi:hypothetical protein